MDKKKSILETLAAALGNTSETLSFCGLKVLVDEWTLDDVALVESTLGSIEAFNPLSVAGQEIALWITLRRNQQPGEEPYTLEDVRPYLKASILQTSEFSKLLAAVVRHCGLFDKQDEEPNRGNAPMGEEQSEKADSPNS